MRYATKVEDLGCVSDPFPCLGCDCYLDLEEELRPGFMSVNQSREGRVEAQHRKPVRSGSAGQPKELVGSGGGWKGGDSAPQPAIHSSSSYAASPSPVAPSLSTNRR